MNNANRFPPGLRRVPAAFGQPPARAGMQPARWPQPQPMPGITGGGFFPMGPAAAVSHCATAAFDILGLLTQVPQQNRGRQGFLRECKDEAVLIDLRGTQCAVGYTVGIVLGIEEAPKPCDACGECHAPDPLVKPIVRAKVEWQLGTAGFMATADFLNGTTLHIPTEQLCVKACYLECCIPSTEIVDPDECRHRIPPTFKVSAGLGYGGLSKNSNPGRLTECVVVPPESDVTLKIPNFALSFNVAIAGDAPTTARVDAIGFAAKPVRHVIFAPRSNVGQNNIENAFPLPNGTRLLKIINDDPDETLVADVIFGLSI